MTEQDAKQKSLKLKINLVRGLFFFFFAVVLVRAYHLQILSNTKLDNLAKSQYKTQLLVSPRRGAIYDRNGEVLALDILVSSVGINPRVIDNKLKVKDVLSKYTDLKESDIEKKINSTARFEWIQRRIGLSKGQSIEKEELKGVQVLSEYRRFYPNKELAGQLLGAVGYDAKALGGVELSFDKYLKSELANQQVERDARGKFFSPLEEINDNHDVYLTIDKNIQSITEEALVENAIKHKVKNGFAIVVDTKTGEILAMANYPTFDPNMFRQYPQESWKNHAITDVFEPGSTFKTMLMSAAINSGKVKSTDRFFCENGTFRIGNNVINDSHEHGWLDAKGILTVSSNIGITKIGQKIGKKVFYDFIKSLGFGEKGNVGLIGEAVGSIRPFATWMDIEFSNLTFGQGLSVNGVQMARAYSAIANGGVLTDLHVVKEIVDSRNRIAQVLTQTPDKKIMTQEAALVLKDMLHSVTQPGGTAIEANIKGYLSVGKTGTAQKYDPKLKAYAANDYVSSFIGFAPLNEPRLMIYVVYDTPKANGYYGGVTAAPMFRKIGEQSLAYLGVTPQEQVSAQVQLATTDKDLPPADRDNQITLALQQKTVPDLRGLSVRKVFKMLEGQMVQIKLKGSGVVVKQMPAPGAKIQSESWSLELSDPS